MKFRTKLLLAQAPLALAVAALGLATFLAVEALGARADLILKHNYRSVLAAQRMKEAIERMDSAALFLLGGERVRADQQLARYRGVFEAELGAADDNLTEPGEAEAMRDLRASWAAYLDELDRYRRVAAPELTRYYFDALAPRFLAVKAGADQVLDINQAAMLAKSERARRTAAQVTTAVIAAALFALALGLFASTTLTTRILRPLSVIAQAARRIGQGDLAVRAEIASRDEIGALAEDFNAMAARLEQYRRSSLGELLLAQSEAQAVIESLPDPVVVLGLRKEVLNSNQAAESLVRVNLEAGERALDEVEPALAGAIERLREHVVGGKGPYAPRGFDEAVRVQTPDGDRSLLPRATPLYSQEGSVAGATVVLQDVTRLMRFDQLKSDLVATVAHEFRTPLTSLRMAIHLCLEQIVGPLTEKQADLLHAARQDCERLQTIVDDLLDLSRVEGGRLQLHQRPIAVEAVLDEAIEAFATVAADRGVELRAEPALGAGEISADPERLQLVLGNLLSNAIRHSPPGGQVVARARAADDRVRFEVSDRGDGIPEEYRDTVFDKFMRIPGRPSGGAGLGLYIVREIVGAHGGEVGFDSAPGAGTTFWFHIPRP